MVLVALEKVLKKKSRKDHRHRIEHASVLNKELIARMKKLGVIASVQPHFIVSDFWVANRLGTQRARWVYPFKTLIKEKIPTVGGSDCPVEPISPLRGIWAAVSRESFPEERITVSDALRMYTVNAAFASFEEDIKGSIEVDKLADLVVLSDDPRIVPREEIKEIEVEMTFVGGSVLYSGG
jgi:predicted amidohydrolase YtcJ